MLSELGLSGHDIHNLGDMSSFINDTDGVK